ncbi:MAG: hypothetical protein KAX49_14225 [Halanaerobiales bacterium]|nr:hypothetical protein [Halanaerobiales bacterium]
MKRKNKIVLLAHCILNQNSVIKGWARARGAFPTVIEFLLREGIGIVQLPCPEQRFLGLQRPPMTVEEYDTLDYRNHCQKLLNGLMEELLNYREHGLELVGVIGIGNSPSCCPNQGIFFIELQQQLEDNGFQINVISLPPDHQEDEMNENFISNLSQLKSR